MRDPVTFVCWKWNQPGCRSTYNATHVNVWAAMLNRHYHEKKRLICITDDPTGVECETFPLWSDCSDLHNPSGTHLPSCYRRLKIFDPATTNAMGIPEGSKVISTDLDVVVIQDITNFFSLAADFAGWKRIHPYKPLQYNGSLFMLRAGRMAHVWNRFHPVDSPEITRRLKFFGSDQGWISYVIKGSAPGWTRQDGIYSYSSDVFRRRFPDHAKIISFNGKHKPWSKIVWDNTPWVREHWRA